MIRQLSRRGCNKLLAALVVFERFSSSDWFGIELLQPGFIDELPLINHNESQQYGWNADFPEYATTAPQSDRNGTSDRTKNGAQGARYRAADVFGD